MKSCYSLINKDRLRMKNLRSSLADTFLPTLIYSYKAANCQNDMKSVLFPNAGALVWFKSSAHRIIISIYQ